MVVVRRGWRRVVLSIMHVVIGASIRGTAVGGGVLEFGYLLLGQQQSLLYVFMRHLQSTEVRVQLIISIEQE